MSNKKFSEFTLQTDSSNVAFVVGFNGSDNVRISPSNLIGSGFLPTSGGTMTGNLLLQDNIQVQVGTGADLKIFHNGTDSFIENQTGILKIQSSVVDGDISFLADDGSGTATEYFRVDGGAEIVVVSKEFRFTDNVAAKFGTGPDLQIFHDGTDSRIYNDAGDFVIRNQQDDGDIKFQSDDGSGGVTSYFELDGSDVVTKFRKNLYLLDNVGLKIGNSFDLDIKHDGSDSFIANATGHLYIKNSADDKDIIFQSDDGSGGVTTYMFLDGSNAFTQVLKDFYFLDNVKARFGDNGDFTIHHDTNTFLKNVTNNLIIENTEDDANIQFKCDDGSGGTTQYFRLDGNSEISVFSKNVRFSNGIYAMFGSSNQLLIFHDGTDAQIFNTGIGGDLVIRNDHNDKDIVFKCDDGSGGVTTYFQLDGGAVETTFSKDLRIIDNEKLILGTSNDLELFHNGTNTVFNAYNGNLEITNFADDKDIVFKSDNGSGGTTEYFRLDGGLGYSVSSQHIQMADGKAVYYGNGNDLGIYHLSNNSFIENLTGDLTIINGTDDGDIIFKSDDGSGGVAEYFRLDGGAEANIFSKNVGIGTASPSFNLTVYNNGTSDCFPIVAGAGLSTSEFVGIGLSGFIANNAAVKAGMVLDRVGNFGTGDIHFLNNSTEDDSNATLSDSKLTIKEDGKVGIGTSSPESILHITDANPVFIMEDTSNPNKNKIENVDGNMRFHADYNSDMGNSRHIFFIDNSEKVRFDTNGNVGIGTSSPASKLEVNAGTDNLVAQFESTDSISEIRIKDNTAYSRLLNVGTQLKLMPNDGVEMMILDGNDNTVNIPDSKKITFGDSDDLQIYHDGTDSFIRQTGSGDLYIQNEVADADVIFRANDAAGGLTTHFFLDGSLGSGGFTIFPDNTTLGIGDNADLRIKHNGTDSSIQAIQGNLNIFNSADDKDIVFQSDDGSGSVTTYFFLDGSRADGTYLYTEFPDNSVIGLGNDTDLQIYHSGTNSLIDNFVGDLIIQQKADDKDIIFKSDDGSGGVAEYFRLDGGAAKNIASKALQFFDNVKVEFGDSSDLEIYHDGSNSYINEVGTGDLIVKAVDDVYIRGNTHDMGRFNEQGVKFYYLGNIKFETNNTGVKIPTAGDGLQLVSPNGTVFTVTVDNSGNLSVA